MSVSHSNNCDKDFDMAFAVGRFVGYEDGITGEINSSFYTLINRSDWLD